MVFLIGFFFTVLSVEGHYQFTEAQTAPQKSAGKAPVVLAQNWGQEAWRCGTAKCIWHPAAPPLTRFFFSSKNSDRDGAVRRGLEVSSVLAHKQSQHGEMCAMRHPMVAWPRCHLCTTEAGTESEKGDLELCWSTDAADLGYVDGFPMGGCATRSQIPMDQVAWKYSEEAQLKSEEGQAVTYGAPEVEPPWQPNYSGGPTSGTAGEDSTGAQEKLAILATALQESNTTLAPNVRDIVNEHTTPAPSTKGLKAAVDKMDKARKKLKEAEKARYNMHAAWRRYIADSLQRWTQFAEKFGKDDQELAERVRAAKEKLQATKEEVDMKKAALEEADEEDQIDISDDDMQEKVDSAENIQASLTNMVANLNDLKQTAEAAIVEAGETKNKRQRTEEPGHGSSAAPPSSKNSSMEPFGKPGK